MAGVAPQRGGGASTTTIGIMIAAIVLDVALIAGLIIAFTKLEAFRTDKERAQAESARLANSAQAGQAREMFTDAGTPGKTFVGEMLAAIKLMSGRLTGNNSYPPGQAIAELDKTLAEIDASKVPNPDQVAGSNGAAAIIQHLYGFLVAEQDARQKSEAEKDKLGKDYAALQETNKKLTEHLSSDLDKMKAKMADLEKGKEEFENQKNQDLAALRSANEAKADDLTVAQKNIFKREQAFAADLASFEKILNEQQVALGKQRGEGPEGSQPLSEARRPIGKVLRALPGDSLVHINLGRSDQVTLGMTFTVYPSQRRIPETGRGKASIEVVSVGERTSECRVITAPSPDDPILEGDPVGNIVLSRNKSKKATFCLVGYFDLNYDGTPDPRAYDTLRALIQNYGGRVVDRVDAATDYLVVGMAPPTAAAADEHEAPTAAPSTEEEEEEPTKPAKAASKDEGEEEDNGDSAESDDGDSGEENGDDEGDEDGDAKPAKPKAAEKKPAPTPKPAAAPTAAPELKESPFMDHTSGPNQRRLGKERERYEEAIRQASALAIPRLTQDHFLSFVGIEPGPNVAKRLQR